MQGLALVLAAATMYACGNANDGTPDAQLDAQIVDAAPLDAAEPDAFNACPGQATFQVGVVDWVDGGNLAGVTVSDGVNQKSSAPNGRVVLCVPKTGALTIQFAHADYLNRVHSTTGEIVTELAGTPGVAIFRLLKPVDADALYTNLGSTRALDKTTVIAMVRDRNTGAEVSGATVTLQAANEGGYTPGPTPTALTLGNVAASDGRVLFLNALAGASSTINATGLNACTAPASVALAAAGISSATIVCSP